MAEVKKHTRNTSGIEPYNLKNIPPEKRREMQSKGGKARGRQQQETKIVREALLELLVKPVKKKGPGKSSFDLKSLEDAQNSNTSMMVSILLPFIRQAREGDPIALSMLLKILGQADGCKAAASEIAQNEALDSTVKIHLIRGEKPSVPVENTVTDEMLPVPMVESEGDDA